MESRLGELCSPAKLSNASGCWAPEGDPCGHSPPPSHSCTSNLASDAGWTPFPMAASCNVACCLRMFLLPLQRKTVLAAVRLIRVLVRMTLAVILPPISLLRPCVVGARALMAHPTSCMLLAVAFTLILYRAIPAVNRYWIWIGNVTLAVSLPTVSHL